MWRVLRILAIAIAVVFGLAVAGVMVVAWQFDRALEGSTKVSDYPRLLEDWSPTGLVDHFPKEIPGNATNVSMSELPGFMQGAGHLQLRMKLPPQEIEVIAARAKAAAVRSCPSQCGRYIEDPEFWSVPDLAAGTSKPERRFPPDFVVYALETNGDWNHPSGKGIAVSVSRSEVVYWAEQ